METDLLRTFVLVAEELNFTRAAERLHLSQPSLSRRIRDLERILGARLFDRGPRKVELTPFGEQQLPRAIAVMNQVDEFLDRARSGGPPRRLTLGIAANAIDQLAVDALRPMRAADPDLQLTIRRVELGEQATVLRNGSVDALIGRSPFEHTDIDDIFCADVWTDPITLVLPSDHDLARRRSVSAGDVAAIDTLPMPWIPDSWLAARPIFGAGNQRGGSGFKAESFKDMITAVPVEDVGAVVPASFASAYATKLTSAVPIDDVEPMQIVLAVLADRTDDPMVQMLFDSVRVETDPGRPALDPGLIMRADAVRD